MAKKYKGVILKDTGKKYKNGRPIIDKVGETIATTEKAVDAWIKQQQAQLPPDSDYEIRKIRFEE